jgi:hypothetical protein
VLLSLFLLMLLMWRSVNLEVLFAIHVCLAIVRVYAGLVEDA